MNGNKNLYEILDLTKEQVDNDPSILKKKYRELSKKYHPDRQSDKTDKEKKEAEEKCKEINEAYSVLNDPEKRKKYDLYGTYDGSAAGSGFDPFSGFGDFGFDFNPFDDIRDFFGNGSGRTRSRRENIIPGENVRKTIPITLEDVYCGFKKKIKYEIDIRCPNCHGTGGETATCPVCNGSGIETKTTRTPFGISRIQTVCSRCGGSGRTVKKACPTCNGSGFKKKTVEFEINIPAGRGDGEVFQYESRGSEAKNANHPNGSLIVILQYDFDKTKYSIINNTIVEKVKIPYVDALLGCKYHLVLPDKKEMNINIKPCTKPGTKCRIRDMGITIEDMYGHKTTGDYILDIAYDIPNELSEQEMHLLTKIKNLIKTPKNKE